MTAAGLAWVRRLPALAYVAGIFYGGVIDIGALPDLPGLSADKVLHALAFLGLAGLLELAFYELPPARRRILAVTLSSGVGGLLELVQAALPYRSADLWDFAADVLGALTGALISMAVQRFSARRPAGVARSAE